MIGIALVAVVGLAAVAWRLWPSSGPQTGFITALHAIDARRAVVLIRANPDTGPSRGWVALIDRDDGIVWREPLAGPPVVAPYDGVSLTGDSVTVRSRVSATENAVEAWSLDGGRRLWSVRIPHADMRPTGFSTIGDGDTVVEVSWIEGSGPVLRAIDRSDGTLRWKRAIADAGAAPRIVGTTLVLELLFKARLFDLATGETAALDTRGAGCVDGSTYYTITPNESGSELTRLDLSRWAALPEKSEVELPDWNASSGFFVVQACGWLDGALVFTLSHPREGGGDELSLVAVSPETGQQRWHWDLGDVQLGGSLPQTKIEQLYRQAFPLSGELGRFVPVMLRRPAKDGGQTYIAILDLAERRVDREGSPRDALIQYALLCRARRCYLAGETLKDGGVVTAFDRTTGALTGAVRIPTLGIDDAAPFHLADEAFWLFTSDYVALDRLPWTVLDAAGLRPLVERPITLQEARAQLAESLAL
jgi:outer membrane protein assembly factor BamB